MELKKLEYLDALYRWRSFTKAADEQYISQPSMSAAIQSLEEELGVTLVRRDTRPLSFTAAGEEFMEYASRILSEVRQAEEAMHRRAAMARGTINLAVYSSPTSQLIPYLYMQYKRLYPNYSLDIHENTYTALLDMLDKEQLDLIYMLMSEELNKELYQVIPLETIEIRVLMSSSNPLADRSAIPWSALRSETIYGYPSGSYAKKRIDEAMASEGVRLDIQPYIRPFILLPMIEQNFCVALILYDSFHSLSAGSSLVTRPLTNPIYLQSGIIRKKGRPMTLPVREMIRLITDFTAPHKN